MPRKNALELTFQPHIADYLAREHKYGVLEQADITDTEHCIVLPYLRTAAFVSAINKVAIAYQDLEIFP